MALLDRSPRKSEEEEEEHEDDSSSEFPESLPTWSPNWPEPWVSSSFEDSITTTAAEVQTPFSGQHHSKNPKDSTTSWTTLPSPSKAYESGGYGTSVAKTSNSGYAQGTPSTSIGNSGARPVSKGAILAASLLPLVLIAFICGLVFVCFRRRRRRKAQLYAMHEAKGPVHEGYPDARPPQGAAPQVLPATLAPQPIQAQDHPIILSPMNPATNNAYFTGLDTSDVMSVTSTGTRATHMDEPPPPYRPRSIATALSRDPSVRHPPQAATSSAPKDDSQQTMRSPFADPAEEEDAASQASNQFLPSRPIEEDEFSAVSDLSYQHEAPGRGSPSRR